MTSCVDIPAASATINISCLFILTLRAHSGGCCVFFCCEMHCFFPSASLCFTCCCLSLLRLVLTSPVFILLIIYSASLPRCTQQRLVYADACGHQNCKEFAGHVQLCSWLWILPLQPISGKKKTREKFMI